MNSKNTFKMAIGMVACCLIPGIILLAVSTFGIASGSKFLASVTPFLCPIMMVGMMIFMGRGKKGHNHSGHSCCSGHGTDVNEQKKIEQ